MVWRDSSSFKLLEEAYSLLEAFLVMMEIWLAQDRDESMCKPSNLKEVTLTMVPVDVLSNGKFVGLRARGPSVISL